MFRNIFINYSDLSTNINLTPMNKDLVIDVRKNGVEIALLEDKRLVELHREKDNASHLVGSVYLGKVRKIMSGLNASFVDMGTERDGFLHYLDLGPHFNSLSKFMRIAMNGDMKSASLENMKLERTIEKNGKINNALKQGDLVLVQITKEPISTKGARLSSEISFAGRFLVLIPFASRVSISSKIKSIEERKRLRRIVRSIKPKNYGIIIRTVAENRNVAEIDADLKELLKKWDTIKERLHMALPPKKLVSEIDKSTAIIRDLLDNSFTNVFVNDQQLSEELRAYIKTINPNDNDIVRHYKLQTPIFEQYGVTNQIRHSFGKVVTIRSGIYLVIEQTEAMCVIDVNSGHRANKKNNQEENALMVNLEAAEEIARQVRLRDIGGIIVIDFIDMGVGVNRKQLFDKMKELMSRDKARHTILPISRFGLMQITRQRVRPALEMDVSEICPLCLGSGKTKSTIVIVDEIENDLRYLVNEQNEKELSVIIHPFVYAYLTKGWAFSKGRKMARKHKVSLKFIEDNDMSLMEYQFLNKNDDIIKL